MRSLLIAAALFATPAVADVRAVVKDDVLPGFATFAASAAQLETTAVQGCLPENVIPAYNETFDAWMQIQHMRIGPTENGILNVVFWPDERGFITKTLSSYIDAEDPVIESAEGFAAASIAVRGLFALEMMLFDDRYNTYAEGSYSCHFVQRMTADLAREAASQSNDWHDRYSRIILSEGDGVELPLVPEDDAFKVIYTQIVNSLANVAADRIGRPLGTLERPRPTRAEAWRSERSLRNIRLATEAAVREARLLMDADLPETTLALDNFNIAADKIGDPTFSDVADDPTAWLQLNILQERLVTVQGGILNEIGTVKGISAGFNGSDGD